MRADSGRAAIPSLEQLTPEELIAGVITCDGKGMTYQKACMQRILELINESPNEFIELFFDLVEKR